MVGGKEAPFGRLECLGEEDDVNTHLRIVLLGEGCADQDLTDFCLMIEELVLVGEVQK